MNKCQCDYFTRFKKKESLRLKKSIEKAKNIVLQDKFPDLKNVCLEEIRDYQDLLGHLQSIAILGGKIFFKHLPSPLEKIRERSVWEVYLAGLRYFARRAPKGFFRKTVLAIKEWQDSPEKVDSYMDKCLSGVSDIANLGEELKKFFFYYEKGKNIIEQYDEWSNHEDVCEIYASLKAWEKEEHFEMFEKYLTAAEQQTWEIIIEGPIQLYLSIGYDNIFFILKLLTLEHIGEFFTDKNKKELSDLKEAHSFVYDKIDFSETIAAFKLLTKKSLEIYRKSLIKKANYIRSKYPTDDLRRKFIYRFESGELFRNK